MSDFFRAHQAIGTMVPTYFIESTAPDNVDDTAVKSKPSPPELKPIDSDVAVRQIAAALAGAPNPNLVVMVHGFNNPEPDVLRTYTAAALAIEHDDAVRNRPGLVCIGYRWPSEKIGQPFFGTWDALPTLPTWILYLGAAMAIVPFVFYYLVSNGVTWLADVLPWLTNIKITHLVTMLGLTFAGLVLTAALLRTIVYFRDTYRATNYGVPDLVQVIRAIDSEIVRIRGEGTNDVQLSFIGHSMGGFVVTNTIRVLSDAFDRRVPALSAYGAAASAGDGGDAPTRNIGNVFRLMRFVLASPDIPAETLLSSRSNFLASALSRFDEAYLFSNEGDEVLRQISTLANYFVFPTKSRNHGFRLGNVEILSSDYGLISVSNADFLRTLRVGNLTIQQLHDTLQIAKNKRLAKAAAPVPPPTPLPTRFTYFDCTDYVDIANDHPQPQPLLTFAKCTKRANPNARLRWYSHLHLLAAYLFRHQKPNVHGGYFEGKLSQQMIYRLACLGYVGTIAAYGSEQALSDACNDKQIRGLLSPLLAARRLLHVP